MTNTHDLRVSARTARLTAGSDDGDDDGPPWTFGGIAVAAGDILHMDDGTRVLMTAEALEPAAETQAGEPLTTDHPEDDEGRPEYPPPVDETVGTVRRAGWVADQQAVGYEAETHDRNIADGVKSGSYEVSVHALFGTEPYDGPEAEVKAVDIEFLDLSVVTKGDSPSNTADWGPNEALAAWTERADFGAELAAAGDDDDASVGLVTRTVRATLDALGFDRRGDMTRRDVLAEVGAQEAVSAPGKVEDCVESVMSDGESREAAEEICWAQYHDGTLADAAGTGDESDGESKGNEPAESGADDDSEHMTDEITLTRDEFHGLLAGVFEGDGRDAILDGLEAEGIIDGDDRDVAAGIIDNVLEARREQIDENIMDEMNGDENASGGYEDGDMSNDSNDKTLGEMTPAEAKEALAEQGVVTRDDAGELVAQGQAQAEKQRKVDEIIASSDHYDKDDRAELLASADSLVDSEYRRVRRDAAATLPANGGGATLTARDDASNTTDPDAYGTGVAGEGGGD